MLACAAADGAGSSRPTVSPLTAGLPATTPCSATGAAALVNEPIPEPGTSTPATIGTLEVSRSPATDAPRQLSATGVVPPPPPPPAPPGTPVPFPPAL